MEIQILFNRVKMNKKIFIFATFVALSIFLFSVQNSKAQTCADCSTLDWCGDATTGELDQTCVSNCQANACNTLSCEYGPNDSGTACLSQTEWCTANPTSYMCDTATIDTCPTDYPGPPPAAVNANGQCECPTGYDWGTGITADVCVSDTPSAPTDCEYGPTEDETRCMTQTEWCAANPTSAMCDCTVTNPNALLSSNCNTCKFGYKWNSDRTLCVPDGNIGAECTSSSQCASGCSCDTDTGTCGKNLGGTLGWGDCTVTTYASCQECLDNNSGNTSYCYIQGTCSIYSTCDECKADIGAASCATYSVCKTATSTGSTTTVIGGQSGSIGGIKYTAPSVAITTEPVTINGQLYPTGSTIPPSMLGQLTFFANGPLGPVYGETLDAGTTYYSAPTYVTGTGSIPSSITGGAELTASEVASLVAGSATSADCGTGFQKIAGVCFPTNTGLADPEGGIGQIIYNLFLWLMGLFSLLAMGAFVVSGIQYLTAAGSENQMEIAKRNATYALIGIVVGLSGFVIVQAIDTALSAQTFIF